MSPERKRKFILRAEAISTPSILKYQPFSAGLFFFKPFILYSMEPEKGNELSKNYFIRFPDPKGKKKKKKEY